MHEEQQSSGMEAIGGGSLPSREDAGNSTAMSITDRPAMRFFPDLNTGIAVTLTYILLLYSTLPLTPDLIGWIKGKGLLDLFIKVPFVVLLILVFTGGLKFGTFKKISYWLTCGALSGIYIFTSSRILSPIELLHLALYGLLGISVFNMLSFRLKRNALFISSAITTSLLGILDEGIQYLLPNRFFDWNDILVNIMGGIMALAAIRYIVGDIGE